MCVKKGCTRGLIAITINELFQYLLLSSYLGNNKDAFNALSVTFLATLMISETTPTASSFMPFLVGTPPQSYLHSHIIQC